MRPGHQNLRGYVCVMETFVSQRFQELPTDPAQDLNRDLKKMQDTVLRGIMKLGPRLEPLGLVGCLIGCYHRHTVDHLHKLLQNINSSKNIFLLMKWSQQQYLSQELLGHPYLQKMEPIQKVDLVLLTEWVEKAKDKLMKNVKNEVRDSLENILQNERTHDRCDSDEAYVRLYVDAIQCIDAFPKEAQKVSSKLSDYVQEVCFQELLVFVRSYTSEQTRILQGKAKMDEPQTIHFFKTLKTCRELKRHVQTKGSGTSLCGECVTVLENMEDFTMKLLLDMLADITETHFKKFFPSDNRWLLFGAVEKHFPKLCYGVDEQMRVMDEAYKVIVCIYIQHLIKTKRSKLEKCWGPNVGKTITEDAEELHKFISGLAPGIQKWSLLSIRELLDCRCPEAQKVIAVDVRTLCLTLSEDVDLLPALLRWKGLSKWEVMEMLDIVAHHSSSRSGSWYLCLICC
ncbi:tumor necrosis factor alpha-induced protein 2-like isoform X2 [Channa argus]